MLVVLWCHMFVNWPSEKQERGNIFTPTNAWFFQVYEMNIQEIVNIEVLVCLAQLK